MEAREPQGGQESYDKKAGGGLPRHNLVAPFRCHIDCPTLAAPARLHCGTPTWWVEMLTGTELCHDRDVDSGERALFAWASAAWLIRFDSLDCTA